jgi:hypothetical protein
MAAVRMVILTVLLAPVIGSTTAAQIGLGPGVFAGGGGVMSGGEWAAVGTIGQSVIGRSIGTSYAANAGFWGDGGAILGVDDRVTPGLPAEFALLQNYPNPFNPSTIIKFEVPRSTEVRLSVFDVLGREVLVLMNERRDAGVHEVKFDASNLASGVYLYRLQAGDFVSTKKLLLLR